MDLFYFIGVLLVCSTCARGHELLICRSTADAFAADAGTNSCKETTDRIQVLEEQVKQLRHIITDGNSSDRRTRYHSVPADCGELYANGTKQSGVYMISPEGRCPFSVYCDMADDGWTVIQRRIDGAVNFYRKWGEYVEGFGDIDGEYWLGLEKIHRLTKEGYEIYFEIENYDGTQDYAHYKSFIVHDVTTLYRMNVDAYGYEGSLNELLSFHDNQKFSTFDRDNDITASNCAKNLDGGGWWYKDCYRLGNPNGIYDKREGGGVGYWDSGSAVFVRNYTIKVRQRFGMC